MDGLYHAGRVIPFALLANFLAYPGSGGFWRGTKSKRPCKLGDRTPGIDTNAKRYPTVTHRP